MRKNLAYSLAGLTAGTLIGFFGGGSLVSRNYEEFMLNQRINFISESAVNAISLQDDNDRARLDRTNTLLRSATTQAKIVLAEEGLTERTIRAYQTLRDAYQLTAHKPKGEIKDLFENLPPTPPCKPVDNN